MYPIGYVDDTFRLTWVSSGTSPSSIWVNIFDVAESSVGSGDGVSSGNGHFYYDGLLSTPGWYVAEWYALIGGKPYRRRLKVKIVENEVD